jgi:lysozyme
MTAVCIDISHWQNFPDFDEVAASGVLGVIHKATEGTSYVDPNRGLNLSNARKAGLAISTYFWIKPGDGGAQARFYLDTIEPVRGERVVIDYEEDGCTIDTLHDAVQALLDADMDLKITVYSGHLLKEQLNGDRDDFLAENTDLWLAQYTSDEDSISWSDGTYEEWTLWQYSESGTIPGVDGSLVDLNNFNGSDSEFLDWINPGDGGGGVKPKPPQPSSDTVFVSVVAPDNITVKVKVVNQTQLNAARGGPDLKR